MKKKMEQPTGKASPRRGVKTATTDLQHLTRELQNLRSELQTRDEELTRARSALRQYEDLYDFSPLCYFTLAQDGVIHKLNLAGANMLGDERSKLVRRHFGLFVSSQSQPVFLAFLEKVFASRSKETCQVELRNSLWVKIEAVFDPSHEQSETCQLVVNDITDLLQIQALREAEKTLQGIFDSTPDSITVVDLTGVIKLCNQTTADIHGYASVDQLIGRNFIELVAEEDRQGAMKDMTQVIIEGALKDVPFTGLKGNGDKFAAELSVSVIKDVQGNPSGFVGITKDVTGRKRIKEALQESEERYRRLVEGAPDIVYTFSSKRGGIYYSPRVKQVLGYSADYLYAHPLLWNESIHPDDRTRVEEVISEFEVGKFFDVEYRIQTAQGNWLWLHDRSIGRNVGDGEILIEGLATDITERKQTEAVLLESEERYHELFNTMPEGFVLRELIFDENGKPYDYLFLDFNKAFEELIGFTRTQLIGRTQREIYPDEDPFWLEIYSRVALGGESVHMEYHPPPYHRYYEAYIYSPVTNQFAVVFREITERKQAEIELHEKEIQYRNLADSGVALIWSAGTDKLCNYFNEPWLKFTGRTLQQELGNGWAEGVHPDDLDRCLEIYVTAFDRREPFEMEYRLRHVSGEYRWLQDLGTPVYDSNGGFTGYIGHCFDITERKQAEKALQASEEKWRSLFEILPIGVSIVNSENVVVDCNPALVQILNISREGLLRGDYNDRKYMRRDNKLISVEEFPSIRAVKEQRIIKNVEIGVETESGDIIWTNVSAAPLFSGAGTVTVTADITERKAAEEEIRRLNLSLEKRVQERTADLSRVNAELEQALKVRDEFLASMSHELRTPLTGILGLSEVLRSDIYGELNDKQRAALSIIEESGRHLLDLINDILDLSKIEAGNLELQMVPCSIEDVCRSSLHLARGVANRKRQNVYYSPAEESIIVCADARRIKQILVNLLGNAIKFTPENGDLGLEVRGSRTDGVVKLTVWDKGIGIKPENLEKLFKPFLQINTGLAREYNGTGLGLALVHRLTEMHKGGIEVKSVFGEGSRFTITLPWPQNDTSECSSPRESAVQVPASIEQFERSNPPLIIMADDSEEALQMVTDYFEFKNARVITVRSGYELLEKIKEFRPDIMLVDIQMPGMDGLEAIHHIRNHEDPLIAKTPIVAVTALAMVGDRELCLRAGADEYVSKPVKLRELAAIIQKLLKDK